MSTSRDEVVSSSDQVSVILPYFNRAETLAEAGASVLRQTHSNLVLYLVNDGSTDHSRSVAHALADGRIVHIDVEKNGGVSRARNLGLAHVKSDLVAFMDSDDVWLSDKLEVQIRELRRAQQRGINVSVIGCGWRGYNDERPSREFRFGPHSRSDVLHQRVAGIGTPAILVDRTAASDARFDESLPALVDRDYVLSCLANGTQAVIASDVLVLVRRGRGDHVATPHRAAIAYERMLEKYAPELESDLRSWFAYRASRELVISRQFGRAGRHLPLALKRVPLARTVHLALGIIAGRKGFALAQKLVPLRLPDPVNSAVQLEDPTLRG